MNRLHEKEYERFTEQKAQAEENGQAQNFERHWKSFTDKVMQAYEKAKAFDSDKKLIKKYREPVLIQTEETEQIKALGL